MVRITVFILFLFIFLNVHAAYFDEISILNNGNLINNTNPIGVRLSDGTNYLTNLPVSQSGTWNINSITNPMAATQSGSWTVTANAGTNLNTSALNLESTQSALNAKIPSNLTVSATRLLVDGSGVTQPISGTITANQGGTWNINNISGTIALPTGAATSALQTTGNSSLSSIDSKTPALVGANQPSVLRDSSNNELFTTDLDNSGGVSKVLGVSLRTLTNGVPVEYGTQSNPLRIDVTGTTVQPVSQSGTWNINNISGTISLPTGAATSALQTTGNSSLSSMDAKTPSLGQALMTASTPVVIASNQSTLPISGTVTANAGTNLNTSLLALDSTVAKDSSLSTINTSINTLLKPASTLTAITTVGTITNPVASTQSGTWNITNISGTVSLPTGAATESTQSTQNTRIGDLAETAPASDTASSGLNGRLQRIAQRLTSLIAVFNPLTAAPANNASGIVVRPITSEYATFSAVSVATTVGNNKSMLAIQNTGTSIVRIREIWIINDQTTAVTGVAGTFEVRRIASFTGGTSLTISPNDSIDSLPSGISAATGATVATETVLIRQGVWSTDEWGPGTSDTESFDHAIQNTRPFWEQTPNGKAITIRQNEAIHVKFATNSTAGAFNIRVIFTTE